MLQFPAASVSRSAYILCVAKTLIVKSP